MAEPGFAADDEIAESLRIIERQRQGKRIAVLGGMVLMMVVFIGAVIFGYSDATPPGNDATESQ